MLGKGYINAVGCLLAIPNIASALPAVETLLSVPASTGRPPTLVPPHWAMPVVTMPSVPTPSTISKRDASVGYVVGGLDTAASGISPFIVLDNLINIWFQASDSNFVVYDNGKAMWNAGIPSGGHSCVSPNVCSLVFQYDGNLVRYVNGVATWSTGTYNNAGHTLLFYDTAPYIAIFNEAGVPIWES